MMDILPKNDKAQALRLKRQLMADAFFLVCFALVGLAWKTGLVRLSTTNYFASLGICFLGQAAIYIFIRLGWNIGFKDPSLTIFQMTVGIAWASYLLSHTQEVRGTMMVIYLLIILFGVFQLSRTEFILVSIIAVSGYTGVILRDMLAGTPGFNFNLNLVQWVILVVMLIWLSLIGSYIKGIREKLKQRKTELQSSHAEISAQQHRSRIAHQELEDTLIKLGELTGQAMSAAIHFEDLLQQIAKTVVSETIATKGCFLFLSDNLCITAEKQGSRIRTNLAAISDAPEAELLMELVEQTRKTKTVSLVHDAGKDPRFQSCPYVKKSRPGSVICLPVIRESDLKAILYLESNSEPNLFTVERMETYKVMASQVGIAFENALLNRELRKTEKALRKSEKQFRLIAENASDLICVVDYIQNKFRYVSPSVKRLLGYLPEEILLLELQQLLTLDSFVLARKTLKRELEKEKRKESSPKTFELEMVHKNGTLVLIEISMRFLYDDHGKIDGVVGVGREITARKKAEAEICKLNDELEQRVLERTQQFKSANEALQSSLTQLKLAQAQLIQSEKMAALGGLVAGVAHEINTPLGVGMIAASLLEEKTREYETMYASGDMKRSNFEKYLKTASEASALIYGNLNRAAELVRSFKQVAVDQSSEERRFFNLKEYIDKLLFSLQPEFKRTRHRIIVTCPADLEIFSYPGAFSQIITNLVMNSLVHGFEVLENGQIDVDIRREMNTLILCYRDNGKGMDPETLSRMFDPFFTTKRSHGGTGLGMHILYNLVTQTLGGRLEYTSTLGEGVVFLIYVPLPNAIRENTHGDRPE